MALSKSMATFAAVTPMPTKGKVTPMVKVEPILPMEAAVLFSFDSACAKPLSKPEMSALILATKLAMVVAI